MKRQHELDSMRPDRRSWLAGLVVGGLGVRMAGAVPARPDAAPEDTDFETIRTHAKAVGLGPFDVSKSEHYAAIGDAPEAFRQEALDVCEAVARDCLKYFQDKGFPAKAPGRRLVVVVLADARGFSKYFRILREASVGGVYEIESNHLVIFDFRKGGGSPNGARANTISLVHEAVHQWTYNTGLLRRGGDVPLCVSEGLAMFVEDRPPTGNARPGAVNRGRVDGLKVGLKHGVAWTPVDKLLADDNLAGGFGGDEPAQQLAYAQDWLLVYHLMTRKLPAFQKYLATIAERKDSGRRLEDAREAFGDLNRLDADLKKQANQLI